MHAGDVPLDDSFERVADVLDRVERNLRHVEQHTVAGQLRKRRGSAAEADVQQLDERVLLDGSEFHYAGASRTPDTAFSRLARSIGLFRKLRAPPAAAISREES